MNKNIRKICFSLSFTLLFSCSKVDLDNYHSDTIINIFKTQKSWSNQNSFRYKEKDGFICSAYFSIYDKCIYGLFGDTYCKYDFEEETATFIEDNIKRNVVFSKISNIDDFFATICDEYGYEKIISANDLLPGVEDILLTCDSWQLILDTESPRIVKIFSFESFLKSEKLVSTIKTVYKTEESFNAWLESSKYTFDDEEIAVGISLNKERNQIIPQINVGSLSTSFERYGDFSSYPNYFN